MTETEKLQQLIGHRLGPYKSFNPVNRAQIWQWCAAMGDHNPLYLNDDYRPKTEFSQAVAPPAMMQMWTMRDFNDCYAPGSTSDRPYQVFDDMTALGYPGNVAVSYDIHFKRLLTEGERPLHHTTVVTISDKKSTALGDGFFVTEKVEYSTEQDQTFAEALITYFQYQPKNDHNSSVTNTLTERKEESAVENQWQPDFKDIHSKQLNIGDTLPELAITIDHRLIVGGAIASQDFIPVHHNLPAAQAAGMPDIFMNILTTSGLCTRYLTDWAGPASRLQHLSFNLLAPNHPGDCMTMQGQIKNIEAPKVTVDFAGKNSLGFHVTGSATLLLSA
ncbi:MaoC family dehydratase N-terminal domain-containing protein [Oceanicoccus sp. KOV_DT_Chl]|uniref:FAS1-like dehydratase domain-containing protein n=1 Tax=Oceanicoccus sp. KOV_DT_Chl TaxID=1904639 RepID=UPI000C7CF8EE|nr:MaoC family dehydratase N-terminal domain-containing protein [Oceanicoccus sp. KOV_DT_Chl]